MAKYFGSKYYPGKYSFTDVPPLAPSGGNLTPYRPLGGGNRPDSSYTKSLDLGRGEYSRVFPGSEEMQDFGRAFRWAKNYNQLKRFGGLAGEFAGPALGVFGGLMLFDDWLQGNGWWKVGPSGWSIPSGWSKCPTPSCDGTITTNSFINSFGSCATFSACPGGQALPGSMTPGPFSQTMIAAENTSIFPDGNPNARYTLRAQFVCSHVITGPEVKPTYGTGHAVPQRLAWGDPPMPEEMTKTYPRTRPRTRSRTFNPEQTQINFRFPPKGPPTKTVTAVPPPAPPPARTRERKYKLGKGGIVGDIFGHLTEIDDFANCMAATTWAWKKYGRAWKKVRPCQHMTGLEKAACLAQYADYTDPHNLAELIKCVALNELGDMAIGRASKAANKAYVGAHEKLGVKGPPRGVGIKRGPDYGTPHRFTSF